MISQLLGAPGNGKSMEGQYITIEELVFGVKDIVTSSPVRLSPWAMGKKPMIGLIAYLRTTFPNIYDFVEWGEPKRIKEGIIAWGRILVVEDESELATLFLWRRDRSTGEWFKASFDAKTEQFNGDDLKRMSMWGNLIITDEAWKVYSHDRVSKDDTIKRTVEFYGRQHRKFSDNFIVVSHSCKDFAPMINRMTQQWRVCTNFGLRRMWVFRQPAYFQVTTYYEIPVSANAVGRHHIIRRMDKDLVQTYDTSAGVAVGGGRSADVNERKKGFSPLWLILVVILLVAGLISIPKILGYSAHRTIRNMIQPQGDLDKKLGTTERTNVTQRYHELEQQKRAETNHVELNQEERQSMVSPRDDWGRKIVVTGIYGQPPNKIIIFLSDGTQWTSDDVEVTKVNKRGAEIGGQWYEMATLGHNYNPTMPYEKPASRITEAPYSETQQNRAWTQKATAKPLPSQAKRDGDGSQ